MDIHGFIRSHPQASADLIKAMLRAESLEAPPEAVKAFMQQKKMARTRGIPFEFGFADWWAFWSVEDRWSQRGRKKDALVMARFGDVGPYAPWNVYCATPAQNNAEVHARIKDKPRRRVALHQRVKRPLRPVETPAGIFDSAAAAAKHFGISADSALKRAKSGRVWRFVAAPPARDLRYRQETTPP